MCTFTVHEDNIYPPPMLSTIDRICLHTPIPPLAKSPALNLPSKNNLTKMILIVDIYITQEYDYFLKVKKYSIFCTFRLV